ncbi:helix-turn-helix domain-containing protein [Limosilactobacillus pontis]|uniref:helix-turn-helix domain-containing protein n=1 Tax=Limosilactobacillus pontis TaxID=35787 RepID=UPI003C6DB3CE
MIVNLGSEIRKRRIQLNLTQEDLAELSNISVNFLSQLERKQSITTRIENE